MTNFQRTAEWLFRCGKTPCESHLSTQIGVHIEEFVEFLECLELNGVESVEVMRIDIETLLQKAALIKSGRVIARIPESKREQALDALCDSEVTGNGVAYLAAFDKDNADREVLRSNDSKLEDGMPVILPGGKIGKGKHYTPPNLKPFI